MRHLAGITLAAFLTASALAQQAPPVKVALTFDDLPATGAAPHDVSRVEVVQSILDTLRREHLPPVYGFVNAVRTTDAPETTAKVLTTWRAAGDFLGNHTWSHPDLEAKTAEQFEAEIVKDEPTLAQYADGTDWHWFRYPFLREGETLEKRQEVRNFLLNHGYRVAEVSLDFEDTMYNAPYARCVDKGDLGRVQALHDSYLAVADEYTDIFRSVSRSLYGREIPYVLLLHVGAATARFLPDLIAQLRERGFTFTTLDEASKDPAYAIDPGIGYPGGGTLQEMMSAVRKVRVPPNAKPYEALEHYCTK